MTLLTLQEVSLHLKGREAPILDRISLEISPGDFIVILGSNGSGKSSLIKVINGLIAPTSGTLSLRGEDLSKWSLSRRARSMATLTQDLSFSTFSELTVLENYLIALRRKKSKKKSRQEVATHLAFYNPRLVEKMEEPVSSLSGGERQTLALAMSLCHPLDLLLLDEHTSALDPAMAQKVMELTAKNRSTATVMTTHRLEDALCYGNRLIAMRQGKILLDLRGKKPTREELFLFYS